MASAVAWSRALTPKLLAGFAVIIVILIATLVVGLTNLGNVYSATEMVAQTYAVKAALQQFLTTAVDAETGERGFVITGATSYLEPYDRARHAIAGDMGHVRTLTADNREQQADLDRLSAETDLKMGELADAIRKRRELGFTAAQAVVETNVGKRTMDEMRAIVARMDAREDALLAVRTAEAAQNYRIAMLARYGTTALAVVVVIALFVSTLRFGAERQRAARTAERFRVTLASIGDAVIATDDQGRVTQMNAVAEVLTGWTAADAAGKRLEDVFVIIDEASRRTAENPIGRVLRDNVSVGLANHTVLLSKDGREIPVDDSAAPIKAADGRLAGAVMVFRDVTERRRAECERSALFENERKARSEAERVAAEYSRLTQDLRATQQRVTQLLESVPGIVWEAWGQPDAANQRIDFVSSYVERMLGYSVDEWLHTPNFWLTIVHPDDRERAARVAAAAFASGQPHTNQFRWMTKDGRVRWVEARATVIHDDSGRPVGMRGVTMDITDRKQTEETFRRVVEAAPTAMIMIDRRGAIVLMNALTESLLGYTREELVGQSVDRLVPSRFRDVHAEYRTSFFTDLRRRPMGAGRDLSALRKDGSEVPVEIGLSPVETPEGTFVLAAVTDITERKRVERSLTEQAHILDLTPDAVFIRDLNDRIVYWNRGAEELYGWPQAEVLGKVTHDVLRTAFPQPLAEILATVHRDGRWAGDLVHARRDGVRLHVASRWALDRDAKGNPMAILEINNDITDRKEMESALRDREREAEQANRLKDQFLAMVSHELRTPLNAMLGWADMLQSGTLQETRRARAASAIFTNAKRQVQLIDELLDVSRIISGKLRLGRMAADLPAVVRNALDVVQSAADTKRIDIAVDTEPSLGPFYADPGRLQQILVNLISNAIKFTPDGGAIHVRLRRAESTVEFMVTDTGQGIPPGLLSAVFEPFRQADTSTARRHGGLGLGLSIVKHLVEAHGGTVWAESAGDGQGSTFTVRLPIVAVHTDQVDAAAANPAGSELAVAGPGPTTLHDISVLVVDDDADSRELLAATLEHYGAVVLTAGSVGQALEMLQKSPVHVLLTDIAMPGEDGYSLIRKVRRLKTPGTADIPAAALTSLAREEDRQEALQAGFQLHMAKPIDARSLVEAVVSLVNRREAH